MKSAKDLLSTESRVSTANSSAIGGGGGSNRAEALASPTKSRYYFSKYGTWKELQKISQVGTLIF